MKRVLIVTILTLLLSVSSPSPSNAQQALQGDWIGGIKIGNETLSLKAHFESQGGSVTMTAELAGQPSPGPISITWPSNKLHFELPRASSLLILEGEMKDGMISGETRQGNARGSFQLARVIKVDPKVYNDYFGTYELAPNWLVAISLSGVGPVYLDFQCGRIGAIYSLSETTFFGGPSFFIPAPIEVKISFVRDDGGKVTSLIWNQSGYPERTAKKIDFRREDLTIHNGDVTLSGTLVLPSTKGPHPVIVGLHGSGAADRNTPQAGWRVAHGIAWFSYDKRGVGKSTGNLQNAGYADLAEDALAAVDQLKRRTDINPKQIGLLGASEGGSIAPIAASRSRDVAFIILVRGSGLSSTEQVFYEIEMVLRGKGFSDSDITKAKALRKMLHDAVITDKGWDELRAAISKTRNEKWFRDARVSVEWLEPNDEAFNARMRRNLKFDPLPFWEKVTCSVLAMYGELDSHTPPNESIAIIKPALMKAGNKDYTFLIFPKSNHNFLEAETGYDDEFPHLKRHIPGYFETLLTWVLTRVDVPK